MLPRRRFLKVAGALSLAGGAEAKIVRTSGSRVKLALNAYSFNKPLMDGSMTLEDVVHYCAEHGIDGLDATGYYFPGYPKVPDAEYVANLKRIAFLNGVTITGTGVRNDFATADPPARASDVQMVKNWIEVANNLGAPVIRVFSGRKLPEGHSAGEVLRWMIPELQECAAYGKKHGVIVALQQHNDFLTTAAETAHLVDAVNSDWFGVILDVGSLRQGDPYREIEALTPYAVSWQIKETVWYGSKETPIDLAKIRAIIEKAGYRGFIPFEALGGGDPKVKVAVFMNQVRKAFDKS